MDSILNYRSAVLNGSGNTMQLVVKVTERCNIACTYCYFFFSGDESYKKHSATITDETVQGLHRFIKESVSNYHFDSVRIVLHGGEPLLYKKEKMKRFFQLMQEATENVILRLTVQTNGMLIDDEWISLFEEFNVYVGISLDGPPEINDLNRIDKRGRGTYNRTIEGATKVFESAHKGRLMKPGLLCVIDPTYSPERLYNHFVKELGFKNVDFLLPHFTFDNLDECRFSQEDLATFLLKILEIYKRESDKEVTIRIFNKAFKSFSLEPYFASVLASFFSRKDIVFTITSDGEIGPDDAIRTCDAELMETGLSIQTASLEDVLTNGQLNFLRIAEETVADECASCQWVNVCGSGDLYHRYSSSKGFNNPSVHCESLKELYSEIYSTIVKLGAEEKLGQRIISAPIRYL